MSLFFCASGELPAMLSSWKWASWPLARNFRPCLVAEANLAESVWQDSVSSSSMFATVTTIPRAHTYGRTRIVGSSSGLGPFLNCVLLGSLGHEIRTNSEGWSLLLTSMLSVTWVVGVFFFFFCVQFSCKNKRPVL